jgi:hypothetical protein
LFGQTLHEISSSHCNFSPATQIGFVFAVCVARKDSFLGRKEYAQWVLTGKCERDGGGTLSLHNKRQTLTPIGALRSQRDGGVAEDMLDQELELLAGSGGELAGCCPSR